MFYQKLNGGDVSVYSKYRNFVPTTKLERTYSILKLANKRDKRGTTEEEKLRAGEVLLYLSKSRI